MSHPGFEGFIIFAILANTTIMALEWRPAPFQWTTQTALAVQWFASILFCVVFLVEMILKLIAYGVNIKKKDSYFRNPVNCFDAFIVLTSLVEVFLSTDTWNEIVANSDDYQPPSAVIFTRTLKGLRTLRLMRLMYLVEGMKKVVATMTKSAAHILYLGMILILFCVIFALLGMETLAQNMVSSNTRLRYDTIYDALINVFIVLSGENWNDLFVEAAAHVGPWAPIYYILVLVLCNWIMLNLFVAILLANINDLSMQEQQEKLKIAKGLLRKMAAARKGSMKYLPVRASKEGLFRSKTLGSLKTSKNGTGENGASSGSTGTNTDGSSGTRRIFKRMGTSFGIASQKSPSKERTESPPPSPPDAKEIQADLDLENLQAQFGDEEDDLARAEEPSFVETLHEIVVGGTGMAELRPAAKELTKLGFLGACRLFCSCKIGTLPSSLSEAHKKGGPRGLLLAFVEHGAFASFIQILIALSSIVLIIDLPGSLPAAAAEQVRTPIVVFEFIVTGIFTIEMFLKLGAYGIGGYFKNSWNLLDFFVICVSWPALFPFAQEMAFIRALRSVRMLKLASLSEGLRVVIVSLYQSLPSVANVMMVLVLFLVIFGILGMQLNAGRWGFCDIDLFVGAPYDASNRTFTIPTQTACVAVNGTWMSPHFGNFDNIFTSVLLLFETATLERWPDIMLYMADGAWDQNRALYTAPVMAPHGDIYGFVILFWIGWIFLSAFVIMNLFVGVVVENFQRNKERSEGTVFLTERQQKWVFVMSVISVRRSARVPVPPEGGLRKKVWTLVTSTGFEVFIITMILASVVAMATGMYKPIMSPAHNTIMTALNFIFCTVFFVECVLKLIGLSPQKYFKDGWNIFDFILVLSSIIDIVMIILQLESVINPVFMRAFRLVRIGRLVRLIRGFRPMLRMINTLTASLPALVNVIGLLLLLLVIYAIAGVSLFHGIQPDGAQFIDWHTGGWVSFQSFPVAMLTLFRCVTGESWNGLMHDLMLNAHDNPRQCIDGSSCSSSPLAAIVFFITFTIFATFMLLNLLIGVILQNFSNTLASGSIRCIKPEQIEEFARVWLFFDPRGSHQMPEHKLPVLLHTLRVNSWVYNRGIELPVSMAETIKVMHLLKIPVRGGKVNFQDTLQGIARAIHHGFIKSKLEEFEELEKEQWGKPIDPKLVNSVAGASHQEVARARARMRQVLSRMRYRSLVRTGVIQKVRIPKSKAKAKQQAARVMQFYWKAMRMRLDVKKKRRRGEITKFQARVENTAITFVLALMKRALHRKNTFSLSAVNRLVDTFDTAKPPPPEMPEWLVFGDMGLQNLAQKAQRKEQNRPPMTCTYAAIIIQHAQRMRVERRAYKWARMFVRKMQANWRGVRARREMAALQQSSTSLSARMAKVKMVAKLSPTNRSSSFPQRPPLTPSKTTPPGCMQQSLLAAQTTGSDLWSIPPTASPARVDLWSRPLAPQSLPASAGLMAALGPPPATAAAPTAPAPAPVKKKPVIPETFSFSASAYNLNVPPTPVTDSPETERLRKSLGV